MRVTCTAATMRLAEARAGVPEPALMQRAAAGLAGVCRELLAGSSGRRGVRGAAVVGLIGSGNNGGDALWAMARLARRGAQVTALGAPERMHPEGLRALRQEGGRVLTLADPGALAACRAANLALDGIVGIGGAGPLRPEVVPALAELAAAGVPIVAVDIPSGVAADTGEVVGAAVRAAVTVTFGVMKPGLLLSPGRECAGVVCLIDIGLPAAELTPAAHALSLADLAGPRLDPTGYKYSRGVVQVTASSAPYPGAQHLATAGARGSGVGMVALHSGPGASPGPVVASHPDIVVSEEPLFARADARVIGPGLGEGEQARGLLMAHLADPAPLVVDASGLSLLAEIAGKQALAARSAAGRFTVVTPHEGEFSRLGYSIRGGRLASAQLAARELGVTVVLKGPGTVVAAPDGSPCYIDTLGAPELGTAGSGDVLAGLCAGLLAGAARRLGDRLDWAEVTLAAARAVGLHGLSGRRAAAVTGAVTAPDIAAELPRSLLVASRATQTEA